MQKNIGITKRAEATTEKVTLLLLGPTPSHDHAASRLVKTQLLFNPVSMPDGQHHQNSAMILAGRACCASASAIAIPASYTYVAEIARLII